MTKVLEEAKEFDEPKLHKSDRQSTPTKAGDSIVLLLETRSSFSACSYPTFLPHDNSLDQEENSQHDAGDHSRCSSRSH
jgi:hypothetical protein